MGDTIWLQIKRGGKVMGGEHDNSIMLRLEKELDALAGELGVAKPSSFRGVWGDSSLGHQSMSTLLAALKTEPDRLPFPTDPSRQHWKGMLLAELEHCASALESAADEGIPFRFRIVA